MRRHENTSDVDSESLDKSDDEKLPFSGITRWEKSKSHIIASIQEPKGNNLELTANNMSNLLEKVPYKGYNVTKILQYGRTYCRPK